MNLAVSELGVLQEFYPTWPTKSCWPRPRLRDWRLASESERNTVSLADAMPLTGSRVQAFPRLLGAWLCTNPFTRFRIAGGGACFKADRPGIRAVNSGMILAFCKPTSFIVGRSPKSFFIPLFVSRPIRSFDGHLNFVNCLFTFPPGLR